MYLVMMASQFNALPYSFYELAISNWLTNKQRPNGMIIRVQGFDKGTVFAVAAIFI